MADNEKHHHHNPLFLHHQHSSVYLYSREVVLGAQDGMVSALGALTGIAVGSRDHFTVVLAGFSMIVAGALSMAIGAYNSITMEKKIEARILDEEKVEICNCPCEEKLEIEEMFLRDGWPAAMAGQMAECASKDDELMLREMAYRELRIPLQPAFSPKKKAVVMFFAWALGGIIPLLPYFFVQVAQATGISVVITLVGLFVLGGVMSKFTKQRLLSAGTEMAVLGGVAIVVGYSAGRLIEMFVQH